MIEGSILLNSSIMKFTYLFRAHELIDDLKYCWLPNTYFMWSKADMLIRQFFQRGREFAWWKDVFIIALQVLYRLGFSRVYTVGCGFHAEQQYAYERELSDEQVAYNQRTYNMAVRQLRDILPYAKEANFEVVSCTPDSAINELVQYRDFHEALAEETAKVPPHSTKDSKHPKDAPQSKAATPKKVSHGHRMMYDGPVKLLSKSRSSVIEVGCGDGYGYQELLKEDAISEYLGVDPNQKELDCLRGLLKDEKHRAICADWLDVSREELSPADFMLCVEVLEHVPPDKRRAFLEKCLKFTKKTLFLSTPESGHDKVPHEGLLEKDECVGLLRKSGFNVAVVDAQWTTMYVCTPRRRVPTGSIVISTYQRDELLELGLRSVSRQQVPDLEILVINDGPDSEETRKIVEAHGGRYIWAGRGEGAPWRIPGYGYNIGAKLARGEVLILMCPEMWHLNNCVIGLLKAVGQDPKVLAVPQGKDDDGTYLELVKSGEKENGQLLSLPKLRVHLPFLMAMKRETYLEVGGYDEDFTGRCFDDNDIVDRLVAHGCRYVMTPGQAVHLYHPRQTVKETGDRERVVHNKKLYLERKGQVVRNVGHEWGVL